MGPQIGRSAALFSSVEVKGGKIFHSVFSGKVLLRHAFLLGATRRAK
jgi:hypothetical protein